MEDKITLDREAFRTLASKTRVSILKSLGRRRKILSELSREFGMSPSTIKEHMDNLARADLVVQIDDGHKWKYYELTPKAREILHPGGSRIYIMLSLSLFAIVVTSLDLLRYSLSLAGEAIPSGDTFARAVESAGPQNLFIPQIPYMHILGLVVFTAIFGITLGYIISRKMSPAAL